MASRPFPSATPTTVGQSVASVVARLSDDEVMLLRRGFLDALPVAAAVVAWRDGTAQVDDANNEFYRVEVGAAVAAGAGDEPAQLIARPVLRDALATFLASDAATSHDLLMSDCDGVTARHFAVRIARLPTLLRNERRCLISLVDRTAEVQTEKSLRLEMSTDSLTGLLNCAGFSERIEERMTASGQSGFALLMIDLRRFGPLNESIGSLTGDELLITVARRLLAPLRAGDLVARTGANEFGVLVRIGDDDAAVAEIGRRLAAVFETPFRLSDLEIRVDCAIGCAIAEPGLDADELIRRVRFATKRAKASRRLERYRPIEFAFARRRFTIETELRRAIEGDRLSLAFQPVVGLGPSTLMGFEALARWPREGDGVSPADFIPVAEDSGLIVPLGRWVADRAIATLAGWDARLGETTELRMAINVSPHQIVDDDLPAMIAAALDRHGIAPARLSVELTESAVVADPARAMAVMAALREQGVELAMDDFGTGYSNLAHLRRLPIDMLKIDRSFVTDMLDDRDKAAIVRAILSLAKALGLATTAEGVETLAVAQALGALGCDRGQGFFFAVPLDTEAAFAYLSGASD